MGRARGKAFVPRGPRRVRLENRLHEAPVLVLGLAPEALAELRLGVPKAQGAEAGIHRQTTEALELLRWPHQIVIARHGHERRL